MLVDVLLDFCLEFVNLFARAGENSVIPQGIKVKAKATTANATGTSATRTTTGTTSAT